MLALLEGGCLLRVTSVLTGLKAFIDTCVFVVSARILVSH